MHANDVVLRSVSLRGPGIARSFILPSLQHVPCHDDSDAEEIRHFPTHSKLKIFGHLPIFSQACLRETPVLDKYAKTTLPTAKSNRLLLVPPSSMSRSTIHTFISPSLHSHTPLITAVQRKHVINHRQLMISPRVRRRTNRAFPVRRYVEIMVLISRLQSDYFIHDSRTFKNSRNHVIMMKRKVFLTLCIGHRAQEPSD